MSRRFARISALKFHILLHANENTVSKLRFQYMIHEKGPCLDMRGYLSSLTCSNLFYTFHANQWNTVLLWFIVAFITEFFFVFNQTKLLRLILSV